MKDILKLVNRWLIIFTLLFIAIFTVNKLTTNRYEVKGCMYEKSFEQYFVWYWCNGY